MSRLYIHHVLPAPDRDMDSLRQVPNRVQLVALARHHCHYYSGSKRARLSQARDGRNQARLRQHHLERSGSRNQESEEVPRIQSAQKGEEGQSHGSLIRCLLP